MTVDELKAARAAQDAGAEVVVKHPVTEEPTDIILRVAGPFSGVQRDARSALAEEQRNALWPFKTVAQREDAVIRMLAACVVGWEGLLKDREPLPCTEANALWLLREFPSIRAQVDAACETNQATRLAALARQVAAAAPPPPAPAKRRRKAPA